MNQILKAAVAAALVLTGLATVSATRVSAAPPGRTAFVSVKEQYKEKVVKVREKGFTFPIEVRTGSYTVSGALPLTAGAIGQFNTDTTIRFDGGLDNVNPLGHNGKEGLAVRLGEDPRYRVGATKATITRTTTDDSGRTFRLVTVALKWNATALNFKVTGIINSLIPETGIFAETIVEDFGTPPGRFTLTGEISANLSLNGAGPMGFGFVPDFSFRYALNVTGNNTQKRQVVGRGKDAEEFQLGSVQLQAVTTDVQDLND